MTRLLAPLFAVAALLAAAPAFAQPLTLLSEDFNNGNNTVAQLVARGWAVANNSTLAVPPGDPTDRGPWGSGIGGLSSATLPGSANGQYFASDFRATGDVTSTGGTISDWFLTPVVPIANGTTLRFFTRTFNPPDAPERLRIRMSAFPTPAAGASTNVGTQPNDVGDFATLLLDINPTQTITGYPQDWAQQTVTVSGLPSGLSYGRFAFQHFVLNAGLNANNGDVVAIDEVRVVGVPEPASLALVGLAAGVGVWRRRRRS